MKLHSLVATFILMCTTATNAEVVIPYDIFARAAVQLHHTIDSAGTDQAAIDIERCYLQANKQEREFGPLHATCVTQDYLLISVLALPYDRAKWWPPYNKSNRYDILVPALRSRIANLHELLNTPPNVVDDTRRRLFDIAIQVFK